MGSVLERYNDLLQQRPLLTYGISAIFLFVTGDVLAQQAVERRGRSHDLARTIRFAFFGGCVAAPLVSQWFKVIDAIQFENFLFTIVARIATDQLLFAPMFLALFFVTVALLEFKSASEISTKMHQK